MLGFLAAMSSIFSVMIMLWFGQSGVQITSGATELFLFSILFSRVLGLSQPPIQSLLGIFARGSACDADRSPTSSVKAKNQWSYILFPVYAFMPLDRDNFTSFLVIENWMIWIFLVLVSFEPGKR
jgi:hypothetical protein